MADPTLGYYQFWEELRARFLRDVQTTHRHNWMQVRLETAGEMPSLQEWSKVQAAYQSKRSLVNGWSPEEDRRLVMAQLTPDILAKLVEETNRRREGQLWFA